MAPRIMFVCLGNICRSPTAHGLLRHQATEAGLAVTIESAGTGDWHIGEPPARDTLRVAAQRGVDLSDLRAQQFNAQDFDRFDLIFAMDRSNLRDIEALRPEGNTTPVRLFMTLLGENRGDVPDPYLVGGYEKVFDLIAHGTSALVAELKSGGPA